MRRRQWHKSKKIKRSLTRSMVTMNIVKLLLPNFSCQSSLVRLFSQAAECTYVCTRYMRTCILLPVTNHYALKCAPCSVYYFSPNTETFGWYPCVRCLLHVCWLLHWCPQHIHVWAYWYKNSLTTSSLYMTHSVAVTDQCTYALDTQGGVLVMRTFTSIPYNTEQ